MGWTVLVNAHAGSSPDADAVREALANAGVTGAVETVERGTDLEARATEGAIRGDALVAAGGDGTVSTVAAVAARHDVPFGVLPSGTLNHFARDAKIPGSMAQAAEALTTPSSRRVDLGEINGHTFINNASLGMYPRIVWDREVEEQRGRPRWLAFAIALTRAWRRYRTLTVRLRVDGKDYVRRTPFVFIGNGRYEAEGLHLGGRAALDAGVLSIFVAPYCGRFDLLRLAAKAFAGQLEQEPKFESFEGRDVTIEPARRRISVAIDGEVVMLATPIRCRIRPGALRLVG
ncbi:MAG TPA: diacylglycerol kinase family protein [Vicinamibacterales bacterium]